MIEPIATLDLSSKHRLRVLRRVDTAHAWTSLSEKRRCRACGDVFKGWEIGIAGGTRNGGPLRLCCPGLRCNAGPEAWEVVMPLKPHRDGFPKEVTVTHGGRVWTVKRRTKLDAQPTRTNSADSRSIGLREAVHDLFARLLLLASAHGANPHG